MMTNTNAWQEALKDVARRLKIVRPLTGLDLETTGLWRKYDRIVQIGWRTVTPDLQIEQHDQFINPEMPIPADAQDIHGISDGVVASAPTFREFASTLSAALAGHDLFGYNVRFDREILEEEYARIKAPFPFKAASFVDLLRLWQVLEPRKLEDAAEHFCGQKPNQLHQAGADIETTACVFAAQLRCGEDGEGIGTSVEELSRRGNEERQEDFVDAKGQVRWRDGEARFAFGRFQGKSLAEANQEEGYSGWVEWLLGRDFPEDLKAIVKNARNGSYPVPPNGTNPGIHVKLP